MARFWGFRFHIFFISSMRELLLIDDGHFWCHLVMDACPLGYIMKLQEKETLGGSPLLIYLEGMGPS
jgi:hypothetical protein